MNRRKNIQPLALPWERQTRWFLGSLTGSRARTLTIAALAVAALGMVYAVTIRHVRRRATRLAIEEVHRAIAAFRQDVYRCPHSAKELVRPPLAGRRYLPELPTDGWGHPLYVRCPGRFTVDQADVISAGPSGSFLVDDNMR